MKPTSYLMRHLLCLAVVLFVSVAQAKWVALKSPKKFEDPAVCRGFDEEDPVLVKQYQWGKFNFFICYHEYPADVSNNADHWFKKSSAFLSGSYKLVFQGNGKDTQVLVDESEINAKARLIEFKSNRIEITEYEGLKKYKTLSQTIECAKKRQMQSIADQMHHRKKSIRAENHG